MKPLSNLQLKGQQSVFVIKELENLESTLISKEKGAVLFYDVIDGFAQRPVISSVVIIYFHNSRDNYQKPWRRQIATLVAFLLDSSEVWGNTILLIQCQAQGKHTVILLLVCFDY